MALLAKNNDACHHSHSLHLPGNQCLDFDVYHSHIFSHTYLRIYLTKKTRYAWWGEREGERATTSENKESISKYTMRTLVIGHILKYLLKKTSQFGITHNLFVSLNPVLKPHPCRHTLFMLTKIKYSVYK